jgi:anti-sigma factor RsiW
MSTTATRDLPCQQIVELVTDYLEGAMDAPLLASFEAHLAGCPHCTHYLEQIEATIRVAGTITAEDRGVPRVPATLSGGALSAALLAVLVAYPSTPMSTRARPSFVATT